MIGLVATFLIGSATILTAEAAVGAKCNGLPGSCGANEVCAATCPATTTTTTGATTTTTTGATTTTTTGPTTTTTTGPTTTTTTTTIDGCCAAKATTAAPTTQKKGDAAGNAYMKGASLPVVAIAML